MKKGRVVITLIGSAFVCLMLAGVSKAQIPQAFVSSHGSDKNPCTTDKPCQTFNQALSVLQAGGEILVQDSGDYGNGFTINKSVTIDAGGFTASVTSTAATDLCTINAGASDRVVLRGISFNGASVGNNAVNVTHVGSLYVERCSITGFVNIGVNMTGGNLSVTGTDVRECLFAGIFIDTPFDGTAVANLVVDDSRFRLCGNGVSVIGAVASAVGLLSNCTASQCLNGFVALGNAAEITLTNCRAVSNQTGINATATVRIANCVVTRNQTGILTTGILSNGVVIGTAPGTNLIAGNQIDGTVTSTATLQ
jgi:hypothetical protein